jgi:hypothetical protein
MKTTLLLFILSLASSTSLLAQVTITVNSSTVPVNAIQNLNYSGTYTASGGASPYTYTHGSGFPAGLTLSSAGVISGQPTAPSFYSIPFTVTARDKNGVTGSLTMTIYVAPSGAGMHNVKYPTGVGVINVTQYPYLADNSGVSDASGAIQQAISDVAVGTTSASYTSTRDTIIYLPAGTYRVDHPLVWGSCGAGTGVWTWAAYISLVGHNKNDTIIKLVDNASGYSSGVNPGISTAVTPTGCSSISIPSRAVIFTAPNSAFGSAANTNVGNSGATGNTGFRNHIMNLTIDTGSSNSAAIGIDYMGSNNCRLSDVNIISDDNNGDTGLSMQRQYQGPDYVKYVTIAGFGKGIVLGSGYANWLEHIVLNRQTTAGIYVASGDVATIRDLKSNTTASAVTNTSNGASITLLDSTLQGGSNANTAVNNTSGAPRVFIRNTTSSGYWALSNGTTSTCAGEWRTDAPINATTPASSCSLNLSVSETPVFSSDDYTSGSASITSLGFTVVANDPTNDYSTAISNAINSASAPPTIYFPFGTYYIANPITINTTHVQRLIFFGAKLSPSNSGFGISNTKVIDIQNIPTQGLWIQNALFVANFDAPTHQFFPSSTSGIPIILQEATATTPVTILNSESISYTSNSGAGTLYLESVNFGPFNFNHQTVYARHLNPELCANHVSATAGTVWILGLKTENRDNLSTCTLTSVPIGNVSSGANFEVLGASIYAGVVNDTTNAMFTLNSSSTSLSSLTTGAASGAEYHEWINETRNSNNGLVCANGYTTGVCSSAAHSYSKPTGSVIPLYIGH